VENNGRDDERRQVQFICRNRRGDEQRKHQTIHRERNAAEDQIDRRSRGPADHPDALHRDRRTGESRDEDIGSERASKDVSVCFCHSCFSFNEQ